MTTRTGKCTNFGLCTKADVREIQSLPDGADFVCSECKRALTPLREENKRSAGLPLPLLLLGALFALMIGGGLYYFNSNRGHSESTPGAAMPSGQKGSVLLRLSGSNTIGAQLAPALVDAWLANQGVTSIHRETTGTEEMRISGTKDGQPVSVEIRAHGSSTAFTDLGAGSADLGMASRKIKAGEAAELQAKNLGDLTSNASERVLGLDGVAVVVNEANSTDSMTVQEVAAIFTGTGSKQMTLYARDDKSGTYDTFKDRVLGTKALASGANRIEDSRKLVEAVAADRNAIGFVGLPYASGAKVLAISERGTAPLIPNVNTVRTESYALSRRLYLYMPANAKPEAREFARFALSAGGQEIVDKIGFVGQRPDLITDGPSKIMNLPGDRLSVDFRFRTGSSELDTKAVDDIKRVSAAMNSQYSGRGLMLVGFADNTGTPSGNLQLSKNRAQAVSEQMKRQGITPVLVTGFGQELPVADNSNPDGRERNRRVEVWLRK